MFSQIERSLRYDVKMNCSFRGYFLSLSFFKKEVRTTNNEVHILKFLARNGNTNLENKMVFTKNSMKK